MRKDKKLIISLRNNGKSYRDIQKETGISRATLSKWFSGLEGSKQNQKIITEKHIKSSTERMLKMNMVRRIKLDYVYAKAETEATTDYKKFKRDPLFLGGLMLYASRGEKSSKNVARISSGEFYIHRFMIAFSEKYLGVKKENIKVSLFVHGREDSEGSLDAWSKELGINRTNFYKVEVIRGKKHSSKLQYGVGMSIISSTVTTKKRLLKWIELLKDDFSK